jgi:hypothetical protein
MKEIFDKLRDTFPGICIGGSYARRIITEDFGASYGDLDFYLNTRITRTMFREILETVIFGGLNLEYHTREFPVDGESAPGCMDYYKMPFLTRRVGVHFPNGELPPMEFMFLNLREVTNIPLFLKTFQASPISECCLELDFSPEGYRKHMSRSFRAAVSELTIVDINIHEDVCTDGQHRKIVQYCKSKGLEYNTYAKSYSRTVAEFQVLQKAKELKW